MSQYAPDLFNPDTQKRKEGIDPEHHEIDWLLVFGSLIAAGFIVWLLSSCNPTTHAYKAIEKHEPKKPEDSARLLKRAAPLLHTPAPKIIPGKVIRVPYPVNKIKKVLDTSLLNKLADSISKRYQNDGVQITKDCEKSIKIEIAKYYRYGVQEGYEQALDSLSKQTYDSITPTTILLPNDSLAAVLGSTRFDLNKAHEQYISEKASKETYRGLFWVLLAALIVSGALNIKQLLSTKRVVSKLPEL